MRKPISSRTTFKIIVIVDSGSGTKFDSTMPRPEMLLTEVWLGTRKKYTAAAMIATAAVRIAASFKTSAALSFLFICVVPPNRNLLHYSKPGLQTQSLLTAGRSRNERNRRIPETRGPPVSQSEGALRGQRKGERLMCAALQSRSL